MKHYYMKRCLSFLLSFSMMASIMPTPMFAADYDFVLSPNGTGKALIEHDCAAGDSLLSVSVTPAQVEIEKEGSIDVSCSTCGLSDTIAIPKMTDDFFYLEKGRNATGEYTGETHEVMPRVSDDIAEASDGRTYRISDLIPESGFVVENGSESEYDDAFMIDAGIHRYSYLAGDAIENVAHNAENGEDYDVTSLYVGQISPKTLSYYIAPMTTGISIPYGEDNPVFYEKNLIENLPKPTYTDKDGNITEADVYVYELDYTVDDNGFSWNRRSSFDSSNALDTISCPGVYEIWYELPDDGNYVVEGGEQLNIGSELLYVIPSKIRDMYVSDDLDEMDYDPLYIEAYGTPLWRVYLDSGRDEKENTTNTAGVFPATLYAARTDHNDGYRIPLNDGELDLTVKKRAVLSATIDDLYILGTVGDSLSSLGFEHIGNEVEVTVEAQNHYPFDGFPSKGVTVPVVWDTAVYDSSKEGYQVISGTLDLSAVADEIYNPNNIEARVELYLLGEDRSVGSPAEAQLESARPTSITLVDVNSDLDPTLQPGDEWLVQEINKVEYGMYVGYYESDDDTDYYHWQTDPTFTGLTPNTAYRFTTRYAMDPFGVSAGSPSSVKTYKTLTEDTFLGPIVQLTSSATEVDFGNPVRLKVNASHELENLTYTYQWYKDGTAISGETSDTLLLMQVADTGSYYCIVTVDNGEETRSTTSRTIDVTINKANLLSDDAIANIYGESITYGDTLASSVIAFRTDSGIPIADLVDQGTLAWESPDLIPRVSDANTMEYTVVFTPDNLTNYNVQKFPVYVSEVKRAELSIRAKNVEKIYGFEDMTTNPTFADISVSGFRGMDTSNVLSGTLALEYEESDTDYRTVGTYTITPSGLTAENYTITFLPGTLTVTPANVTVYPIAGQSKVFGETDPELQYGVDCTMSVSNTILLNDVTFPILRTSGEDVGTYTYQLGAVEDENYNIIFDAAAETGEPAAFTITPKPAEVIWNCPELTYNGSVQDDAVSAYFLDITGNQVPLPISVSQSSASGEQQTQLKNAGTYNLRVSGESMKNYTLSNTSQTIDIIPQASAGDVVFPTADVIEYGSDLSESMLQGGDASGTFIWADGFIQPRAGTHAYPVVFTPADENIDYSNISGYQPETNTVIRNVSVTVNPRPIIDIDKITVYKDKVYDGTTNAAVQASDAVRILEGDDVELNISAEFDNLNAGTDRTVSVSFQASGTDAANYSLPAAYTITGGSITKAPLVVKAPTFSVVYGTSLDNIHQHDAIVQGLMASDTLETAVSGRLVYTTDYQVGDDIPTNGAEIVASGYVSDNYEITYMPGVMTIEKLPVAICAENSAKTVGDNDPVFKKTYQIADTIKLADGIKEKIESALSRLVVDRDAGESVGFYPYVYALPVSENFMFTELDGNGLTIANKTTEVLWTGLDKTFITDGTDQSNEIAAVYLAENGSRVPLTLTFTINGNEAAFNAPGVYTVTASATDPAYTLVGFEKEVTMHSEYVAQKKPAIDFSKLEIQTEKTYDGTTSVAMTYADAILVDPDDDVTVVNHTQYGSANAGEREIFVKFSLVGTDSNKYISDGLEYTIPGKINKATLTVKPNDVHVKYGESIVLDYRVDGLVNNETLDMLSGTKDITYDMEYKQGDDRPESGTASLNIEAFDASSENYDILFEPATIYIDKAVGFVEWVGIDKEFTEDMADQTNEIFAAIIGVNDIKIPMNIRFEQNGVEVPFEQAGTYVITAYNELIEKNYVLTNAVQTITISGSSDDEGIDTEPDTERIPISAGAVSIDYQNQVLKMDRLNRYAKTSSGPFIAPASMGQMPALKDWFGKTIYFIAPLQTDGKTYEYKVSELTIPVQPDAPVVSGSEYGIRNTTLAMEYAKTNSDDWIPCTEGITKVAAGNYLVRYTATATAFASKVSAVEVFEKENEEDDTEDKEDKQDKAFGNGYRGQKQDTDQPKPVIPNKNPVIVETLDVAQNVLTDLPECGVNAAINFVVANKLMVGETKNKWSPEKEMSRAMFVSVLHRMVGSPKIDAKTFDDVSESHWASDALSWARTIGITNGTGNNTFSPNQSITQEEMAVMLYRLTQIYGLTITGMSNGTTTQGDDYKETAIKAFTETGVFQIDGMTDIQADTTFTRAEIAQVIMNFCTAFTPQITVG